MISDGVSEKNIAIAEKFGFELPKEKVEEWKTKLVEQFNKNISNYESKISEWKLSIDKLSIGA